MERVKNILQRLQEVYYGKHQKSAIDIDLMLDYTRVMYADLLEWRNTFKEEPPTTETAEPNKAIITREEDKKEAPVAEETAAENTTEEPEEPETTEPEEAPVAEEPAPATEEPASATAPEETAGPEAQLPPDKAYQPMQHDEPVPREPVTEESGEPVVETEPEKEPIDTLQRDATGISFEPPSPPEPKTEVKEELLMEEPAVQPVVAEKAAPTPAAIPLPDMNAMQQPAQAANLFSSVKAQADIRSAIGINDKYLFLNELFRNHKSNYEETLDQLNHFSTVAQAEDWIRTKVAPVNKWEQDDATVTSFYAIIQRHFSER